VDAAEPAVADTQTDSAGGGLPTRRRRKWGWFAKVSVGASVLTTVLALAFAVWLQRSVQSDSTAGQGYVVEQSIRSTTTTAATVPTGAVYVVYDLRSPTTTRAEQAAAVSLTQRGLQRAGLGGVEVQCVGNFVLVVVPDRGQFDAVIEVVTGQGVLREQSVSTTPPDTPGHFYVGCEQ
jgi:hypothetical protein